MERMKDLTQQYVEQLENMVKDLREKKLDLEEENKKLKDELMQDMKEFTKLEEENRKLRKRIDTMQEFIDYSEGVVYNAIQMLYEEGGAEKVLDYLENCYAVGDDRQYEEMEKLD